MDIPRKVYDFGEKILETDYHRFGIKQVFHFFLVLELIYIE